MDRTDKLVINQNVKWSFRKVKSLGVWLSINKEEAVLLNYQDKEEKISKILSCWQLRRLTLLGKVTVIKSLAASQLVYIMSSLPSLPSSQSYLKEIHQLLYNFLWDGRGDKIKRSVMINEYKDGGLKMLDIRSFNYALKSKWVKKYLDDNNQAKWKLFDFFTKQHDGKLLLIGNLKHADVAGLNIQDSFTKEVIEIWSNLTHEENLNTLR